MKKIISTLLICAMMLAIAACGGKEEPQAAGTTAASAETTAASADTTAAANEAQPTADIAIEGSVMHATVNAGDYLTIKTGVTQDRKENDPMRFLNYDGITVEYDFAFGEDGIMTVTLSENQDAYYAAVREKVEQALKEYYQVQLESKGLTVSVEKYMEMEKVDVDHYVKVGTNLNPDVFAANTFATSMFPKSANYVVDAGSKAIYWSTTYSDARLFDGGVKWTYDVTANGINITSQTNKGGYAIDDWAGVSEVSKITTSEATIFPIVMVQK